MPSLPRCATRIERSGSATLLLDLLPDFSVQRVQDEVSHPRGSRSLSSHLQSRLGLKGVKANLLREVLSAEQMHDPSLLARTIKDLPLHLVAPRPLREAISTAGGIAFEALDAHLMLKQMPGVFCAGRCWTGKRRPAVTCSAPVLPADMLQEGCAGVAATTPKRAGFAAPGQLGKTLSCATMRAPFQPPKD